MPLSISHLLGTCFSVIRHFPHPFELPLQPTVWICTHSGFAGTELPTLPAHEEEDQVVWGSMEVPGALMPAAQISTVRPTLVQVVGRGNLQMTNIPDSKYFSHPHLSTSR